MDTNNNLLITSFYDALAVLGDYAKEELLIILKSQHGIVLSENQYCSKKQIEEALLKVLGSGGEVIINLWNEKLEVLGNPHLKDIDEAYHK